MSATPQPSPPSERRLHPPDEEVVSWAANEDGFAIGCESANPALQIESWVPQGVVDEARGAY